MILLRRYAPADSESLCKAIDRVCADTPWMATPRFIPTGAWTHALHAEACRFHRLLVAEVEGEVVGWCRSFPAQCSAPPASSELGIGLLAPYRNRGLGSELVLRSLAWAMEAGLHSVGLTVSEENTIAIHVFEKAGFETTGLQDHKRLMSVDLSSNPAGIAQ